MAVHERVATLAGPGAAWIVRRFPIGDIDAIALHERQVDAQTVDTDGVRWQSPGRRPDRKIRQPDGSRVRGRGPGRRQRRRARQPARAANGERRSAPRDTGPHGAGTSVRAEGQAHRGAATPVADRAGGGEAVAAR